MLEVLVITIPRGEHYMKMHKISILTLATLSTLQLFNTEIANAKAQKNVVEVLKTSRKEDLNDRYYQIKAAKIRELSKEEVQELVAENVINDGYSKGFTGPDIPAPAPTPPATVPAPVPVPGPVATGGVVTSDGGVLDSIIMVIDKLIAIGQKIIPTIKEGKAVVTNNSMAAVSVLPRFDTKDPVVHEMGGWTIPVTKHYQISYENGLGMEVVSFVYSITYQYNGNVDGNGKYLAGIRASAQKIDIVWGFDLDASSQLIQISNVGTQKNVIAGATIEMTYTVKNWTRTVTTSESFHITGDGRLYKLD